MKEYEIRVTTTTIVYVDAEDDAEAEKNAAIEAFGLQPDSVDCEIISSIDESDMDITICGERGCDGCLLQHSRDIEKCKEVARQNKTKKAKG